MRFSLIPFLLLAVPMMEIAAFIAVGSQIGVFPTLALVVLTAVAGSILLRIQGFGLIDRIRQVLEAGGVPDRELVHGVMILLAGVLLLTPGFVTDTMGFLLFIPPIRDAAWRFLRSRVIVVSGLDGGARRPGRKGWDDGRTIDLDADDYGPGSGRRDDGRISRRD